MQVYFDKNTLTTSQEKLEHFHCSKKPIRKKMFALLIFCSVFVRCFWVFGREFGSLKCFSVRLLSGSVSEWSECPLSWVNFLVQSAFGIYTANHERGFILLGWPVIRKYFSDSPIFHVLKGWNSVLIGAVGDWNHSFRGWSPFFTRLNFKWVTMTTWANSDVIPWEFFAIRRIKPYSKRFQFF